MKKESPKIDHMEYFQQPHPSIKERIAAGKALRVSCARRDLGKYKASPSRKDPVSLLEKQAETRIPELVPVRYARMLTSPFAFLRGSANIMAADLAANNSSSGLQVQACGDMHIANFGVFASAERQIIFGINDFDETLPGPWEWDLKRLVASIVVGSQFLGGSKAICEDAVRSAVTTYRKRMKEFAQLGNLELWYTAINEKDVLSVLSPSARATAQRIMAKARQRTHMQVLGKLTDLIDEKYRFREYAPFIVRQTHTDNGIPIKEALSITLESYLQSLSTDKVDLLRRYRITDVVRKVVGVGSVGTRCWVIFLTGNDDDDPLFLQIKEAQASVLSPYNAASKYTNHGHRVVAGQRLLQSSPDIFLGWGEVNQKHFYVRQLRDMKGGLEFDPEKVKIENLHQYTSLCGWALALAHAKSGDAAMLAGYVGNSEELDDAMVKFSFSYALQNEKDYDALLRAAKSGRIKTGKAE